MVSGCGHGVVAHFFQTSAGMLEQRLSHKRAWDFMFRVELPIQNQMVFNFGFDPATLSLIAGALSPVVALLCGVWAEKCRRRRKRFELPQKEKLLRPPGYSLRKQIEALEEKVLWDFVLSMGFCGIAAAFIPILCLRRRLFTAEPKSPI
jgi:hypothetical protein